MIGAFLFYAFLTTPQVSGYRGQTPRHHYSLTKQKHSKMGVF